MDKNFCNYENSKELKGLGLSPYLNKVLFNERGEKPFLHSEAIDFLLEKSPIKVNYSVMQSHNNNYYLVKHGYDPIETHFTTKDELISHMIKLVKHA